MTTQPEQGLLQAYEHLKSGNLESARTDLEEALQFDLENQEILYTLKCINFWEDRLRRALTSASAFEIGESIISQWKQFIPFLDKMGRDYERSLYAIKHGVFSLALRYYQTLFM